MGIIDNLIGREFGRLKVIEFVEVRNRQAYWLCKCKCGNTIEARGSHLKQGNVSSCKCYFYEYHTVHGECSGGYNSPEYQAWIDMNRRCYNSDCNVYSCYGGRGIIVCDEWKNDFQAFLAYMGRKPSGRHSLDRKDNDGNYEPGNVRWATKSQQAFNRRERSL